MWSDTLCWSVRDLLVLRTAICAVSVAAAACGGVIVGAASSNAWEVMSLSAMLERDHPCARGVREQTASALAAACC